MSSEIVRGTFLVRGRVQGVGLRWWTRWRATELGLDGHARNTSDGRVEVVAQGERTLVEQLRAELGERPSSHRRPGWVEAVSEIAWSEPREGSEGFLTL